MTIERPYNIIRELRASVTAENDDGCVCPVNHK